MELLRIIGIYPETISDGYGLRYAIYFAGCAHRCPGCHNPESHDPRRGEPLTVERAETICAAIAANPILDGVTLSGGDPLLQPEAMAAFLRLVKERTGQNVWCYTGYTLEECLADPARRECLRWIDTLVDGRYVEALRDLSLDFRGVQPADHRRRGLAPVPDRCVKKELGCAALFYAQVISTDAGGSNCRLRPCFCRCAASLCRRPRSAGRHQLLPINGLRPWW